MVRKRSILGPVVHPSVALVSGKQAGTAQSEVTGYKLDDLDSIPCRGRTFIFDTTFREDRVAREHMQCNAISTGGLRSRHLKLTTHFHNSLSFTSSPPIRLHSVVLGRRGNFTLFFKQADGLFTYWMRLSQGLRRHKTTENKSGKV